MITLTQFKPALGSPFSASPFCTKVEVALRASGLAFNTKDDGDSRKAPKQKLPMIHDGGEVVADSTFILKHLKKAHGVDFDSHLNARDQAIGNAFKKMCEEHLAWGIVQTRWFEEDNWQKLRATFFNDVPAVLRGFVSNAVRKQVQKSAHGHGMGRHTAAEIYELCAEDLDAIATYLGEGTFMHGEKHSSTDLTVFAFLTNIVSVDLDSPLKEHAMMHANLVAYVERMIAYYA